MRVSEIMLKVTPPWWAAGYVNMCRVFAALHGVDPDDDKIAATVTKHVKIEIL